MSIHVTKDKFVSHDTVPLIHFDGRHEMENMREKSSIQLAFSKRQKTDLSSLEFELNRLKFFINVYSTSGASFSNKSAKL